VSGEEFEWVPLRDTATAFPGSCWWDVNAREQREADDD
jgi:hypothetical protein